MSKEFILFINLIDSFNIFPLLDRTQREVYPLAGGQVVYLGISVCPFTRLAWIQISKIFLKDRKTQNKSNLIFFILRQVKKRKMENYEPFGLALWLTYCLEQITCSDPKQPECVCCQENSSSGNIYNFNVRRIIDPLTFSLFQLIVEDGKTDGISDRFPLCLICMSLDVSFVVDIIVLIYVTNM